MLVLLSGGTGTPKLLQGMVKLIDEDEISVIVNTAEDEWLPHGYFSPDIDTVMYTLAGKINEKTWYGIEGDTFKTKQGYKEVLRIGDMDRRTHIHRGKLLKSGKSLSEAIEIQRRRMGIKARVFPMSDDRVKTTVKTDRGEMSFQEFWVENKGLPEVVDVSFKGIKSAKPCRKAVRAVRRCDGVVIGPSNPVSSILPIISLKGVKEELRKKRCVAVSPFVSGKPVSGPAAKFMQAKGFETNSTGIARIYEGIVDTLIVDKKGKTGIKQVKTNTIMKKIKDKVNLAKIVLDTLYMN